MKYLLCIATTIVCISNMVRAQEAIPFCAETVTELEINQISPLGFSASDLLELARETNTFNWVWDYRHGETTLHISISEIAPSARLVERVAVYPDGAPDIEIICSDSVEVDVEVVFHTDDGAFDEIWHTTLYDTDGSDCMPEIGDLCLAPGSQARFDHEMSRNEINGDFYRDAAVADDLTIDFFANATFSPGNTFIDVFGHAYSCSGDDEDLCYAYFVDGGHSQ